MPNLRPWPAIAGACALSLLLATAAAPVESPSSCLPQTPEAGTATPAGAALERGNRLAAQGDHAAALDAFSESGRLARASGEGPLAVLASASAARSAAALGRVEGLPERVDGLARDAADAGRR